MEKSDMFLRVKEVVMIDALSVAEEHELLDILLDRINGRRKCLASVIEKEIRIYENEECSFEKYRNFYLDINQRFFWETVVGSMEAGKLSSKIIKDFIAEVREQFVLEEIEEYAFIQLLQIGLNKLEDDGEMKFPSDRLIYRKFAASKRDITFIRNPYSETETTTIMKWAESHPADVRAQAVSLWFTKGLTLNDIVTLTKRDCWGKSEERIVRDGIELFCTSARAKIVRRALDTHPPKVKYIFSVPSSDYIGWERLTEKGLLIKLKTICKKTGIVYKQILVNEAIKLNKY